MRLKLLLSTVLAMTTTAGFCAPGDFVGSTGSLSVERTTTVPGDTLKAGSYSISVTEQLADRMIVRVDSTTSKNHAIFLGVPSSAAKLGGGNGPVTWGVGVNKTQAIRGFVFPNGNAVEFVYPKADAAALAKENQAAVVAVDPRSEGKVALKNLSQDELSIVNLWLLSMTTTGVESKTPAVSAKHYDGSQSGSQSVVAASVQPSEPITPDTVATSPAPVQRASLDSTPFVQSAPVAGTRTARKEKADATGPSASSPSQVASLEQPKMPGTNARPIRQNHGITQLPHTASALPLFWMAGLMCLLGAGLVRLRRMWMTGRA